MSKRFLSVAVLAALFAVFAAVPTRQAVFAQGGAAANAEKSYQQLSIALIFPDSNSRAVTDAMDYNRKTGTDVMDVDAIFKDLTAAFQRNFKSVVRVEKMDAVKALNVDLVAVVDLQYTLPVNVDSEMSYVVSAIIKTPDQTPVDTIRGSSVKIPASFPGKSNSKRISDAVKVAAIEAEYRLEDSLHLSTKMASFSKSKQVPDQGSSPASPLLAASDTSGLTHDSSPEKTIVPPSATEPTAVQSEDGAGPFSKKSRKTRSSRRTSKAKSSPLSKQVSSAPSSDESAPVLSTDMPSTSSMENGANHALSRKQKAALKRRKGASARKEMAALTPSPEQKRTGTSDGNHKMMAQSPYKNAYAVVVGVEQYRQKLPRAEFASHDAQAVSDLLTNIMGYPAENVITLIDDHATNADLAKYLEKWLPRQVKTGGTVFVYFSGLGTSTSQTGDAFLVPYDGDPAFIDQTGYSLKRLGDALRKLPAKEIIVVLDSCFSGAGGKSVPIEGSRSAAINLQKAFDLSKNMTVLAAASGDQGCSSYQAKGYSLFTYYLLNGIKDEDVMMPDGSVDIDDLFSYLQPQVERVALKNNNSIQSPQLIEQKKQ